MDPMESQATPSTTSPPSDPSSTARPVACLRCRHRRSYCSKDRPKCSRCRHGNYECIYEEGRKITVNETLLEEKVKAYEGVPDPLSSRRKAAKGMLRRQRSAAGETGQENEIEDDQDLLEPFNKLSMGGASTIFKGPGASDNFLRSLQDISGLYDGDDETLHYNPEFYDPRALPSRREYARLHARLPPLDVCRRLFEAQYTYIGTIFSFTDPQSFDALLLEAHRGPPNLADKDACLNYAKVLIILAFGQLYSVNQWIDFNGPPGFEYFKNALQLLPDPHEEGSITCVETLALVGYFMQNMNRRDAAFLYIGMALRMAISLGLHQEVTSSPSSSSSAAGVGSPGHELDEATREHRRRVWWSVYSLDRILSVKSGNPITIQDEDVGVALPSKLPHEPAYCPAVVLRHYTELSRILSQVTTSIYRKGGAPPKSGRRLMAAVQSIALALSNWNRDLPAELRFNPARLGVTRESVSTFSHYYQCINMTARPLLFHVFGGRLRAIRADPAEKERDWKEGLSQATVRVIEMCLTAAQETIHMMTIAAQRDLVATYGYMDGEHIFSATIVLVMVCAAFPDNAAYTSALNAGLDLLRGMAERGNSHMGARHQLLVNLRNAVIGGGAAGSGATPPPPAAAKPSPGPSLSSVSSTSPRNHAQIHRSPHSSATLQQQSFIQSQQQQQQHHHPHHHGHHHQQQQHPQFPLPALPSGYSAFLSGGAGSPTLSTPPSTHTAMLGVSPTTAALGSMGMGAATNSNDGTGDGSTAAAGAISPGSVPEMPSFTMADEGALRELFFDESAGPSAGGAGMDFGLWEEGFANPAVDAGYDFSQWTVLEGDGRENMGREGL